MLSLVERVDFAIRRHDLFPPGARALVAVSGGADSTALAQLLEELAPRAGFLVAGLAHFNHRLRPEAGEDERFCAELAARLSVPFEVGSADVAQEARRMETSIEDAGRRLRYSFLEEAADRLGASRIAVGHTLDDQAETVLLALIRGAGPRGLAGMRPRRGRVVRPLLEETHAALLRWLAERDLEHREDESNLDPRYLRNRVRHELLPLLRVRFSPAVASVLARSSAIAADDADLLDEFAGLALSSIRTSSAEGGASWELDVAALLAQPPAVGRRVALLALREAAGEGDGSRIGFDQANRVLGLAAGAFGGRLSLPGVQAWRLGDRLVLAPRLGRGRQVDPAKTSGAVNLFRCSLSIPGEAPVPGGRVLSSELRPATRHADPLSAIDRDPCTASLDPVRLRGGGLAVRFRRPGDSFRPLGLGGRKKLQDFFVDRKVPRGERDAIPLVVDGDDTIVWVAGHAVSEDFCVGEGTRDVVILKLRGESV